MRLQMLLALVPLLIAVTSVRAQDADPTAQTDTVAKRTILADEAAPVSRSFYTGALNWYWQPGGASTSITGSGYATTTNGGTISSVTVCLYSESSFNRQFKATSSVIQGTATIQAITFAATFPGLENHCHQLTGFNAVVLPGEFRVAVTFDEFDADRVFAGIPTTDSGQIFDIAIGSQRPPFGSGTQGPVRMKGIGIGYRIAENDVSPPPPPLCVPDADTICLNNGRFKVEATYQTATTSGAAKAAKLTEDTGYFSFFNVNNVEVMVKVLDACVINNRYWVFAAGLTNQGVDITVTDTSNPAVVKHYANPLNRTFVTVTDTDGLASCP